MAPTVGVTKKAEVISVVDPGRLVVDTVVPLQVPPAVRIRA
jgi:hypothetical protein